MGAVVNYRTLEHVAMQARPYPSELLEGCENGLCLFSAAFLGHNDAIWFAQAGMRSVCVDIDYDRLSQMNGLYPKDWVFVQADAWEFATWARALPSAPRWDAVSVDCFTGDTEDKVLRSLDLWCALARELVTVTITLEKTDAIIAPPGWRSSLFHRANNVYWLVLERR